jgi:class 3 adenylate cyclase
MTAPQLDRRLLAILAADVVGYSRMMDADEPGTIARLKVVRSKILDPLIALHRGRLVKLMGDGALITFDSVVDAVTCAIEMQQAMGAYNEALPEAERMVLRVGINLGDVAVVDDDIYGEGVNVAARLEQLCEPGGVLVSGTAFDQLQGKLGLPLDFAGEQQVKNISRPVRTYRARLDGIEKPVRRSLKTVSFPATKVAAVAILLIGITGGWWLWSGSRNAAVATPTVAVLPFDNMSNDPADGRLADGITEDVITDLSRYPEFNVIARNSTAV